MSITNDLTRKAVKLAFAGHWQEAISLNKQIVQLKPKNIAALNRLARAYTEIGEINKAKKTYQQTLEIDRYNPVALKNLDKLSLIKKTNKLNKNTTKPLGIFIDEAGKTKTVKAIRLGQKNILVQLAAGDQLEIEPKKRLISLSFHHDYVGSLPEDLSFRLIGLIKKGNQYAAFVKSAEKNNLTVFLRETFQSEKTSQTVSFPVSIN